MSIDTRWATAHAAEIRRHAEELAALAPDVILAHATPTVGPLLQVTRTVPIVFPVIVDPVGAGFVESLARPGGNATGFTAFEYGMSGKWLELLKQITPSLMWWTAPAPGNEVPYGDRCDRITSGSPSTCKFRRSAWI